MIKRALHDMPGSNHTPESWGFEWHEESQRWVVVTDEPEPWYLLMSIEESPDPEANAMLSAAAPDMYDALWNAVALFEPFCKDDAQRLWLDMAVRALDMESRRRPAED